MTLNQSSESKVKVEKNALYNVQAYFLSLYGPLWFKLHPWSAYV